MDIVTWNTRVYNEMNPSADSLFLLNDSLIHGNYSLPFPMNPRMQGGNDLRWVIYGFLLSLTGFISMESLHIKSLLKNQFLMGVIVNLIYLICPVYSIISLLLIMPILILSCFYMTIVSVGVKMKHGWDTKRLTGLDQIWAQETETARSIITTIFHCDSGTQFNNIVEILENNILNTHKDDKESGIWRLMRYPKLIHGYFYWLKEDNFNIHNHCRVIMVESISRDEVEQRIGTDCNKGFPEKMSPWEIIFVVPKESSIAEYYLIFRIHHCLGDGISLMSILSSSIPSLPVLVNGDVRKHKISPWVMFIVWLKAIFYFPLTVATGMKYFDSNSLHGQPLAGKKIIVSSAPINIKDIKRIKRHFKVTFNSVIMSCVWGAFDKYFKLKGEPTTTHVSSVVPVLLQTPDFQRPMLQNNFGFIVPIFPINRFWEKGRLRLQSCFRILDNPDRIVQVSTNRFLQKLTSWLPEWMTRPIFMTTPTTFTLSNIPGPGTEIVIGGDAVKSIMFWQPHRGSTGVSISAISYRESFQLGIMVDSALIQSRAEAMKMVNYFTDELETLLNVATQPILVQ